MESILGNDKLLSEKVQRRASKMMEGFGNLSYKERLCSTGLTTLEEQRIRGDSIKVFKMVNGISIKQGRVPKFFSISVNNRTRGDSCKLEKKQCNTNIRSSFFSQRIVNHWNGLPEEVVSAESVNTLRIG